MKDKQKTNVKGNSTNKNQATLAEQIMHLQAENIYLRHELEKLKRMIFGARSERFVSDVHPSQLLMGFNTTEQIKEEETETISYERKKADNKEKAIPVRQPIPAHLPREIIELEPADKTADSVKIGEEITEVMEYKPGTLYVKKYIRPKYVLKNKESIVIAELPTMPIPKAIAGASLLAHIEVSKFVDHLPFYRQR